MEFGGVAKAAGWAHGTGATLRGWGRGVGTMEAGWSWDAENGQCAGRWGRNCWGRASASPRPVTESAPLRGILQPKSPGGGGGGRGRRARFLGGGAR